MSARPRRVALWALGLVACASAPPAVLRTAALPSPAWIRVGVDGTTIALHHPRGGSIAASLSCDAVDEDAPLDVLVNHLLLQLEAPIEHGRRRIVLDGREAIRAGIGVRLDGVAVELDLVVLKKDGCVVDAQLAAAPAALAALRPDFDRFVAGISVARRHR